MSYPDITPRRVVQVFSKEARDELNKLAEKCGVLLVGSDTEAFPARIEATARDLSSFTSFLIATAGIANLELDELNRAA